MTVTEPLPVDLGNATTTATDHQVPFAKSGKLAFADPNFVDPIHDFGAAGDGTTDDSTAVQAAIDFCSTSNKTKRVYIPPTLNGIACNNITLKAGVILEGDNRFDNTGSTVVSRLKGLSNASPIITTPNGSATLQSEIRGVRLHGGQDSIISGTAGIVGLKLIDVTCSGPARASFYMKANMQQITMRDCDLSGGQYGLYFPHDAALNSSALEFLDKSVFENVVISGVSINAALIAPWVSNHNTVKDFVWSSVTQDGFILSSGARNWTFIKGNTEGGAGRTGGSLPGRTTGTITTGTNSITVASVAGLTAGGQITVWGAGTNATDLTAFIDPAWNGIATTFNLFQSDLVTAQNAGNSVSNAAVDAALYDEFKFTTGENGSPANIVMQSFVGGGESLSRCRYSVNAAQASQVVMIGCSTGGRQVYDPNSVVSRQAVLNAQTSVRRSKGAAALAGLSVIESNLRDPWEADAVVASTIPSRRTRFDTGNTLVSGTLYVFSGLILPEGIPINSITFFWGAGPTTSTDTYYVLLDKTDNIIAKTSSLGATNPSGKTARPLAFDASNNPILSYLPPTRTLAKVGLVWQGTGSPTLVAAQGGQNSVFNEGTVMAKSANTGITGGPTSMPAISGASALTYLAYAQVT